MSLFWMKVRNQVSDRRVQKDKGRLRKSKIEMSRKPRGSELIQEAAFLNSTRELDYILSCI
jgi:hypothetical protein